MTPYSPAQAVAITLLNCRVTPTADTTAARRVVDGLQQMGWRLSDEGGPVVQPPRSQIVAALILAEGATPAEVEPVMAQLIRAVYLPADPAGVRAQVREALASVRVVCPYCDGNGPPDKGGHVPCRGCGGSKTPGLVPATDPTAPRRRT